MSAFRFLAIAVVAFAAVPASAHPKLLSSTPAAGAVVAKPTKVSLTFSEKLLPAMSGITLTMTAMPGMANHAPMKIAGFKTAYSADGKTMTAALPRPLPAGTYALKWHVVSGDTHRIEGDVGFTVK